MGQFFTKNSIAKQNRVKIKPCEEVTEHGSQKGLNDESSWYL